MSVCISVVGEVQNRAHCQVIGIGARGIQLVVNASCIDCDRGIVRSLSGVRE